MIDVTHFSLLINRKMMRFNDTLSSLNTERTNHIFKSRAKHEPTSLYISVEWNGKMLLGLLHYFETTDSFLYSLKF